MSNTIRLKRASGSDPGASDLVTGEVAVRTDNGKLFTKKDDNSVTEIGGGISDVVDDTSPQLGGNLDVNTKNIVFGDSGGASDDRLVFGAGTDLSIYHNGTNSYINNATGALAITGDDLNFENAARNETYIECDNGGAVKLYYDNSKKLETTSTGTTVTGNLNCTALLPSGNLELVDSNAGNVGRIRMGAGDDFEIYHDASHSWITNNTGNLYINPKGAEVGIALVPDGKVELRYDDAAKLETTSAGVTVTGTCTATAFSGDGTSISNVNALYLGSITAGQFMRDDQNQTATGLITLTTGLDLGSDARCAAAVSSLSDGATITVDFTSGIHHTVTLGGNRTFGDPGNTSSAIGQSGSIFIVQDGTGSRTGSFHSDYKFAGGTAPTLSTAANAVDRLDYVIRASDNVHCVVTLDVK